MSPRQRQLFAFAMVVVFTVVAPVVVLNAGGWRWTGWHQGFVPTGAIVITSVPRAAISLNGHPAGTTAKRLSHLAPGVYQLTLTAPGRALWRKTVTVTARQALVVGPVQLFPTAMAVKSLSTLASSVLVNPSDQHVFQVDHEPTPTIRQLWPLVHDFPLPPALPTLVGVATSPHDQLLVMQTPDHTWLAASDQIQDPWMLPTISDPFWLPTSEKILYGRQAGSLLAIDTIARQTTDLGRADQAGPLGSEVWRLKTEADQTTIWRQGPTAGATARPIFQRSGEWRVVPGPADTLVVRHTQDRTTVAITFPLIGQPRLDELGPTEVVAWTNSGQPPLWTDGEKIMTWDSQRHPLLLDRRAVQVTQMAWLEAGHILLTVDQQQLTISSVSDRQGRGPLLVAPLGSDQRVVALSPPNQEAIITGPVGVSSWSWRP